MRAMAWGVDQPCATSCAPSALMMAVEKDVPRQSAQPEDFVRRGEGGRNIDASHGVGPPIRIGRVISITAKGSNARVQRWHACQIGKCAAAKRLLTEVTLKVVS